MLRNLVFVLAVTLAACSQAETTGQAAAPGTEAAAAEAAPAAAASAPSSTAPPGADETITAWARAQYSSSLIEPVTIFYGDFTGDGAPDALAWADYATGGTSWDHGVALFRNQSGRMVFWRMEQEVYGMEPSNPHFSAGRITLVTKMPGPNDPRCCPTQSQTWTINAR